LSCSSVAGLCWSRVFIKVIVGGWNLNVDSGAVPLNGTELYTLESKMENQKPHPPAKDAGRVGHPRVIQSGFAGGQESCGVFLIELLQDVIA
jgi:hypothetical protein